MSDGLGRRAFFTRLFSHGVEAAGKAIPAMQAPMPSFAALTFPKRQLGNTGEWVPIIGVGTAAMGRGVGDDVAAVILNKAVDAGVNYIDTAPEIGGYGRAQKQIARALGPRRNEIFLTTKLYEPDAEASWKLLLANLDELKTERVDLLFAHGIGNDKMDPAVMFSKNGVFDTLMRAKEQGLARFVGATAHCRVDRMLRALADYDLDVIMTAVNYVDAHIYGYDKRIWPFAHRKGVGIVAMKVFGGIPNAAKGAHKPARIAPEKQEHALRFALGLDGCATAVIGMTSPDELEENIRRARAYSPLTEGEQNDLLQEGESLAASWGEHLGPAD